MPVTMIIPTPLRKLTAGRDSVQVQAGTVDEAVQELERQYPGVKAQVCDDSGSIRRFMNLYVDGEDVRFLDNLATPVSDGAEIAIVPAISGGRV